MAQIPWVQGWVVGPTLKPFWEPKRRFAKKDFPERWGPAMQTTDNFLSFIEPNKEMPSLVSLSWGSLFFGVVKVMIWTGAYMIKMIIR